MHQPNKLRLFMIKNWCCREKSVWQRFYHENKKNRKKFPILIHLYPFVTKNTYVFYPSLIAHFSYKTFFPSDFGPKILGIFCWLVGFSSMRLDSSDYHSKGEWGRTRVIVLGRTRRMQRFSFWDLSSHLQIGNNSSRNLRCFVVGILRWMAFTFRLVTTKFHCSFSRLCSSAESPLYLLLAVFAPLRAYFICL